LPRRPTRGSRRGKGRSRRRPLNIKCQTAGGDREDRQLRDQQEVDTDVKRKKTTALSLKGTTTNKPLLTVPSGCKPSKFASCSDIRLKRDIGALGRLDSGIELYRFRYKWSDKIYVGVMAQDVARVVPSDVIRGRDGYLRVNYNRLGLRLQTWDEWVASNANYREMLSP
jgi:hypothetical protein